MREFHTSPCAKCKEEVISATTLRGVTVVVNPVPVSGGTWQLSVRPTGVSVVPLATKSTPKLSFGTKRYVEHKTTCQPVSPWTVRKP